MELGGATALPCCRPRSEVLASPSSSWWSPAGAAASNVLPEILMCPTSSPAVDAELDFSYPKCKWRYLRKISWSPSSQPCASPCSPNHPPRKDSLVSPSTNQE